MTALFVRAGDLLEVATYDGITTETVYSPATAPSMRSASRFHYHKREQRRLAQLLEDGWSMAGIVDEAAFITVTSAFD